MKALVLCCVLCLIPALVYSQTSYDDKQDTRIQRQEDRFNNYIQADSTLSGKVETELGGIKWALATIAGAIIVGVAGLVFGMIKKKAGIPIIILAALMYLLLTVPLRDAECQGGCQMYRCRVNMDCPMPCWCNQYYFTCMPR